MNASGLKKFIFQHKRKKLDPLRASKNLHAVGAEAPHSI
jgi:hypothetical protein